MFFNIFNQFFLLQITIISIFIVTFAASKESFAVANIQIISNI